MPRSVRRPLAALSGAVLAVALSACGVGGAGTTDSDAAGDTATAEFEEGAFPVTIPHKFGETTLTEAPKRVVVVGLVEQDALLALGVTPVAVTKWFGEAPGQVFPWATEALGDDPLPQVLTDADGISIEKVKALNPDLVIGQYAGVKQEEYDKLSAFVPTVVQPEEFVDFGVPWQDATLTVGKAIGRPQAAQDLVTSVEDRIAKEAADHPEFKGKQAIVATNYEGIFFYGPQDPRARILTELGFEFPPAVAKLENAEFGTSVSAEQTDLFDVDTVVWLSSEDQVATATGGLWAKTNAAKEGRSFTIFSEPEGPYYVAQSMVTPLSIPYVLDRYVPQLAAAVDGDPATEVPASDD